MKLKFHVYGGGDPSVGIWPTEATIVIEDNFADRVPEEREEAVKQWKDLLRDYYDLPIRSRGYDGIWTEEEHAKMMEDERKLEREMEIEVKRCAEERGVAGVETR